VYAPFPGALLKSATASSATAEHAIAMPAINPNIRFTKLHMYVSSPIMKYRIAKPHARGPRPPAAAFFHRSRESRSAQRELPSDHEVSNWATTQALVRLPGRQWL
jgi:hypothetical protein